MQRARGSGDPDDTYLSARLRRKMARVDPAIIAEWANLEDATGTPSDWVLEHARDLHDAGLTAQDGADLHRRLGEDTAKFLSSLINAGRMADIDIRYVHLWAGSGLLRARDVSLTGIGRRRPGRPPNFTRWVTEARSYISACGGDQHAAALSAAAGLGVTEAGKLYAKGELDFDALRVLAAIRDTEAIP